MEQNQDLIQELQCSICLVNCSKPVRCKGPCQNNFCLKCAAQAKCADDRCPHRCSKPFEVQTLKTVIKCPFKPTECVISINNEKQIEKHYLICPFVSQKEKKKIELKINYRCEEGHPLTFMSKQALQVLYGMNWSDPVHKCKICQDTNYLCRAMCITCSTKKQHVVFCTDCRIPPCSQKQCPLGHTLKHRSKPGKWRFCDLCDVPAGLVNSQKVHGFCPCDFDLCDVCYNKLPQNLDKPPLKCNSAQVQHLTWVQDDDSGDSEWKE